MSPLINHCNDEDFGWIIIAILSGIIFGLLLEHPF